MKNNIAAHHPKYTETKEKIELTRACVKGYEYVKDFLVRLVMPESVDRMESDIRFNAYKKRAIFVNFTGETKEGFAGLIFRKDTQAELPEDMEYLRENFNGAGLSLDQTARYMTGELMAAGRVGALVDFPQAEGSITKARAKKENLAAYPYFYNTEAILDWHEEKIGGVKQLVMVKLYETRKVKDGFSYRDEGFYRMLLLEKGVYIQRIYNEEGVQVGEDIIPKMGDGSHWNFIPFVFAGANDNTPNPDDPLLYNIAHINIGHFRNSADFEESSSLAGQPMLALPGLTEAWAEKIRKWGVMFGSNTSLPLPVGADAKVLQASPNTMAAEGMKRKEEQLVKVGAKIISDMRSGETVDGVRLHYAGQTSKLGLLAGNVEDALNKMVDFCKIFMGSKGDSWITVNRALYEETADPQLIMAQIALFDRGIIAKSDMQDSSRAAGLVSDERTNEEIDEDVANSSPLL